ncbi:DUF4870 domain-containing protein [Sinosporangium siamense]|uniref:DUF4870 domain-containing protein n=1 Tax=Sinosporangium siamense TaxID=1367973 RepID=A0A919V9A9_9ACTN|nr:DUF4870 domain-containing protein [Sinosporangium siamense]GII89959.1 hypothetical protein Ssi02_01900 [Sinosporangium siamense]
MSENPHEPTYRPPTEDYPRASYPPPPSADHTGGHHAGGGYQGGYSSGDYPPPQPDYGTGGGYPPPGQGYPPPGYGYEQPAQGYGYEQTSQGYGYGQPAQYGSPYGPHVPGRYGPRPGSDDTNMAMLAHLSGLGNLLLWPLGFIGSLVVYLTRKDQAPYARDQAAEALNFWITMTIAFFAVSVAGFILTFILIGVVFFLVLPVIWIYALIVGIMASVAASRGQAYRYPTSIRMVK